MVMPATNNSPNPNNNNEETITMISRAFILLENPRKSTNWGPVLRCAAAFGISQIVVVGYDKCSVQGSHGASKHVELVAFPTQAQAVKFLKNTCKCTMLLGLLGGYPNAYNDEGYNIVEQDDGMIQLDASKSSSSSPSPSSFPKSKPIHTRPFPSRGENVCFVIGKKSIGLPISLALHCDSFCHVPHHGMAPSSEGDSELADTTSALLNGETCMSIALHQFSAWAEYQDGHYVGQKYEVERITKGDLSNREIESQQRFLEKQQHALEADSTMNDACLGNLMGLDDEEPDGDY
jgi:hypothetical protein